MSAATSRAPDARILSLPKAHLHLHFPRCIRPTTLAELAAREGVSLTGFHRYSNLAEFLARPPINDLVTEPSDLRRVCRELVEDEARDGVLYVEPMVLPQRWVPRLGTLPEVYGLIRDALWETGREWGVEVGVMLGFNRGRDAVPEAEELAQFAASRSGDGVVAFGFGGDEALAGPEPFARACALAREAGLLVVPHAGEVCGPESVAAALDALRPDRIAHGVRAVEDPGVLARLAAERVVCDVCPTSNLRLGLARSPEEHPLGRMLAAGVPVTLGADDPVDFGVTASGEYALARDALGLSEPELARIARTSARASGASDATKARIDAGVSRWLREGTGGGSGRPPRR